jgi:hypothetical protein
MRQSYDCKRNVQTSASSMIRTAKSCWWSFAPVWKLTHAYNWPNALLQEPHLDRECTSSIRGDPEMKRCRKYQSKINNASLQKCACAVCWELVFKISSDHLESDDPSTIDTLQNLRIYGTVHEKADFACGQQFAEYEGLPLLVKAMDADNRTITVCKTCLHGPPDR